MSEVQFTPINQLTDSDVHALIRELEEACGISATGFLSAPLMLFLTQCFYPDGAASRCVRISSSYLAFAPLLDSTVGKLPDGDLRTLCMELAIAAGRALEFYSGSKLAAFLNKTVPKPPKPKKLTAQQSRWERVAKQRRANRR